MENSLIAWTDSTVNFWSGCTKVSAGCKFCYMERKMGKTAASRVSKNCESSFTQALKWKGQKIFTCSMSDFFIEAADGWRADAWDIIRRTPQHSWQILTKRPERIMDC